MFSSFWVTPGADPGMGQSGLAPPPPLTAKSCKFSLFWGISANFPPILMLGPPLLTLGPSFCKSWIWPCDLTLEDALDQCPWSQLSLLWWEFEVMWHTPPHPGHRPVCHVLPVGHYGMLHCGRWKWYICWHIWYGKMTDLHLFPSPKPSPKKWSSNLKMVLQ